MNGKADEGAAAFFDLDGTLVAPPSLERRFVKELWRQGVLGWREAVAWLREALRLLPAGSFAVRHGNKKHLGGISSRAAEQFRVSREWFFEEGLEQVLRHAKEGDAIVFVSGTLEPLAALAAREVEGWLAERGTPAAIQVIATRLESESGRWTGRILGEPMAGEAKRRAVRRVVAEMAIRSGRCYAYGNTEDDLWMLEATGHPCAVNPARRMERLAREAGWRILRWDGRGGERFRKLEVTASSGMRNAENPRQRWELSR